MGVNKDLLFVHSQGQFPSPLTEKLFKKQVVAKLMPNNVPAELRGPSLDELLAAAQDSEPSLLLSDLVLKLNNAMRDLPEQKTERLLSLESLVGCNDYIAFLRELQRLAASHRKNGNEEKLKIVEEVASSYTGLLLSGSSFLGVYAASMSSVMAYAKTMAVHSIRPGWHYYALLSALAGVADKRLALALVRPANLAVFMELDAVSAFLDGFRRKQGPDSLMWPRICVTPPPEEQRRMSGGKQWNYDDTFYVLDTVVRYEVGANNLNNGATHKDVFETASKSLVSVLLDESDQSVWRQFLLFVDVFALVVKNSYSFSYQQAAENFEPVKIAESQELVEHAYEKHPDRAFTFIHNYFHARQNFIPDIRARTDHLVRKGEFDAARLIVALKELQWRHVDRNLMLPYYAAFVDEAEAWDYWCSRIADGSLSPSEGRSVMRSFWALRDTLIPELGTLKNAAGIKDNLPTEEDISAKLMRYTPAFTSRRLLSKPEYAALICEELEKIGQQPDSGKVDAWLSNSYSPETLLGKLRDVHARASSNGVVLTPVLLDWLFEQQDLQRAFDALSGLMDKTRRGMFSLEDRLQVELEFGKFLRTTAVSEPNLIKPYLIKGIYRNFGKLGMLPPEQEELKNRLALTVHELTEADRAAYEAAGFLRFITEFRAATDRPIVIIGNTRYGELFVVKPLEEWLDRIKGLTVRYFRVSSGETTEFTIPHPSPTEIWDGFARRISVEMPHIVIVDGAEQPNYGGGFRFSRATLGYANWVVAFNHIKAAGNVRDYADKSSFPQSHLTTLTQSPEFGETTKNLKGIVLPGETYAVVQWAPGLDANPSASVSYHNIEAKRVPISPGTGVEEIGPLLVIANPIIYQQWMEGRVKLPKSFEQSHPFYWDDPNRYTRELKLLGFGRFGLENRGRPAMDESKLVELVQTQITRGVGFYLADARS